MNIKSAFTAAWQSFKGFVGRTDAFLVKNAPTIQKDVTIGIGIASAMVPSAAPALAVFGTLEEAIMGEVTAAIHTGNGLVTATDGSTAITLSAELSDILKHLANTLAGHPAVVAANTPAAPKA